MDLSLDESQEILVSTFQEMLEQECPVGLVRDSEATGYSPELWSHYCEMGANVMGLPESAGGLGMSLLELGLVANQSGRVLAPVPFVEVATAGRLVASLDPNDPLVSQVVEGTAIPSIALPRPHAVLGTASPKQGPALVPFGAVVDRVVASRGDALYVVSDAKQRRSARLRDAGSGALAHWNLDQTEGADCRSLASGASARDAMARANAEWKLLTAFWLVGLAQRALDIGAEYARERIQFGVPIGGFQAIAHPLAECATAVDGSELLAMEAAWADPEDPDRFEALAAMAFVWASQTAMRTTDVSLHTHGGYGFSEEYDIQLYYRRACAVPSAAGGAREELQRVAELCYEPGADARKGEG